MSNDEECNCAQSLRLKKEVEELQERFMRLRRDVIEIVLWEKKGTAEATTVTLHAGPTAVAGNLASEADHLAAIAARDGKARSWRVAETEAVAKARAIVDGWARELETLAEDLRT
jgi:hypothetical protein